MRSLIIILLTSFLPLPALAEDGLLHLFAGCTGRLSAQMEHHWLMGRPAEEIQAQRSAMITLLDAIQPPDQGKHVLQIRIGAKFAHAALLQRATFNEDASDADWAAARAEVELAHCASLVLS